MPNGSPLTTAFVVSLLPARFLVRHGRLLNVSRIVVVTRVHEQAYAHVASRLPGATVQRLRGGPLLGSLQLVAQLMVIRARGRRVVFFHECCWPLFDVTVGLLRPSGLYFPQVTMSSFEAVDFSALSAPRGLKARLQRFVLGVLRNRFVVYRTEDSPGRGYTYRFSYRQYPASIAVAPVGQRPWDAGPDEPEAVNRADAEGLKIILVTGTEPVRDEDLRAAYRAVIEMAKAEGYQVFVKDHPIAKLAVSGDDCIHLDATMPIELVTDSFDFSIGVASTAILGAGHRKVSILETLSAMGFEAKRSRREHLLALPGGDRVEFVSDLASVRALLKQHRQAVAEAAASR